MRKLISILLFLACAMAHSQAVFFGQNVNSETADGTPIFSPAGPSVANPTTITFSNGVAGGIYCSTQDGTTPVTNGIGTGCTNGTLGGTASVAPPVTLKAVSGTLGYLDSAVTSVSYTLAVTISAVGTPACAHAASGGATSVGISYTPHATGDIITVGVGTNSATISGLSVVDNGTYNTYTCYSSIQANASSAYMCGVLSNNRSGAMTITASWTGGAGASICVSEYAVSSGTPAFGTTGTNTQLTSGSSPYAWSNSVTTGIVNDWQVTMVAPHSGNILTAWNSGVGTIRASVVNTDGSGAIVDNSSASTGPLSVSGTISTSAGSGGQISEAGVELCTTSVGCP